MSNPKLTQRHAAGVALALYEPHHGTRRYEEEQDGAKTAISALHHHTAAPIAIPATSEVIQKLS